MILTIRKIGDPILEKPCREITNPLKHKRLIKDMTETAIHHQAAGLAANQVGQSVQLFLLSDGSGSYHVVINSKFESLDETTKPCFQDEEACLSVPKIGAIVSRYNNIKVNYLNHNGEPIEKILHDFDARVFQHEHQHLQGELFLKDAVNIFYIK